MDTIRNPIEWGMDALKETAHAVEAAGGSLQAGETAEGQSRPAIHTIGKADLQEAINMLEDAHSRVKKLVARGMSQDEVLAENPLADYHEQWNWGFITTERMTATLYRSLTAD